MTESPRRRCRPAPGPGRARIPGSPSGKTGSASGSASSPIHLTGGASSDWCSGWRRWVSTPTGATTTRPPTPTAGPRWPRWPSPRSASGSAPWSTASTTALPISWRARPPTSIAPPAAAWCSDSASGGWRKSSRSWACPSHPRRTGSGRWRRPSPSCAGCGPANRSPSAARVFPPRPRDPGDAFLPPVQEPYVPFLLAGGGEKTTLRQVARFADAANMGAHPFIGQAVSAPTSRANSTACVPGARSTAGPTRACCARTSPCR